MKKLILIDGSNLMFRAYYATAYTGNLMQNSKGQYTNAIFAFVNMMNKILSDDFTHILVAFDKSGKTFRHDSYTDYKAGRKDMPEEFRQQLPLIYESLDGLGVKQSSIYLIEADDIIGTYSKQYYDQFDKIEIISNDKDLLQLVNDKVILHSIKGSNDVLYTPKYLFETMGVTPSQITDLKGLMGDASDNLPGIPGVGEKTAVKLLEEYKNLENVIEHKDEIKGKLGERIREHFESAILCKKIATIKTDVELEHSLDEILYEGPKEEVMIPFFQDLELHSLIKKFAIPKKVTKKEFDYEILQDVYEIDEFIKDNLCIVLESFNPYYHEATPLGFGLSDGVQNVFIPFDLALSSLTFQMYLSDRSAPKSVFDYKQMNAILLHHNFALEGVSFDLLLAAYILNPNNTKEDFRVIVSNFDYTDVSYLEEVYDKGAKYHIPEIEKYAMYACRKAFAIHELKDTLLEQIKDHKQEELLNDIELPLSKVLSEMEVTGIYVDKNKLHTLHQEIARRIATVSDLIYKDAGEEFNISSPKQLGVILFEKLSLPFGKKTKTGYSTNVDVLEKLVHHHPIVENIMTYRMLTKLYSTYIVGLENAISPKDGRIHTIYRQAFTSTGRLSSVEPNLQNIPIRYEEGREIRKVFVPKDNHIFIASDYSQIELRVLAHMANEQVLIESFKNNEDIHTKTAQIIFDKEHITSLERRQAKAVNFGIIYGQTAWGLSEGIDISPAQAKRFIEKYYERFPGIKGFMDDVVAQAEKHEYVETIYHRRRYVPEVNSSVYMQKEAGKRNAMNAPIQGSAADIIKIAMIKIDSLIKKQKLKSRLLLQIHDELVFEVPLEEQQIMEQLIRTAMEEAVQLKVPLLASLEVGNSLYDAK